MLSAGLPTVEVSSVTCIADLSKPAAVSASMYVLPATALSPPAAHTSSTTRVKNSRFSAAVPSGRSAGSAGSVGVGVTSMDTVGVAVESGSSAKAVHPASATTPNTASAASAVLAAPRVGVTGGCRRRESRRRGDTLPSLRAPCCAPGQNGVASASGAGAPQSPAAPVAGEAASAPFSEESPPPGVAVVQVSDASEGVPSEVDRSWGRNDVTP